MVGGLPEQVDRHHRLGFETEPLRRRDPALQRGGIDVERRLVDIDEHRRRAGQRHGLAGRAEGEGRAQHGIARAKAFRHQHHQQRISATGDADDMLGAGKGREISLELRHLRAVDELAVIEHAGHRLIDRSAEPLALRADVDEGNGLRTQLLIHGGLRGFLQGFLQVFLQVLRNRHRKSVSRPRAAAPCGQKAPWRGARRFRGSGSRSRGWRRPRRPSRPARRRYAPP